MSKLTTQARKKLPMDFYTFLLAIKPLLEKLGILLGTDESIRKATVYVLSEYKNLIIYITTGILVTEQT